MKIKKINQVGLVNVKFSEKIQTPDQIQNDINNQTLGILHVTVLPYKGNDRVDKLNLTWDCVSFTEDGFDLQLSFADPLYVSHGGHDYLQIKVLDNTYFKRKAFLRETNIKANYIMEKSIPS